MSGHSKWSSIKHKKAAKDAKRGALFTKLIKDIQVAARTGGSDISGNFRLKIAIQKAKENNMPSDNIERAIKKGAGELEGVSYNEYTYEGYGPGGVAFMVSVLSDNKNRSSAEVRMAFSKNGGNMAEAGAVSYLFDRNGIITISTKSINEEELLEIVLDAGASDIIAEQDEFQVITSPESFTAVVNSLQKAKIETIDAEVKFIAKTDITVDEKVASECLAIMEKLEELEDVVDVYANFDIPDEIMEKFAS